MNNLLLELDMNTIYNLLQLYNININKLSLIDSLNSLPFNISDPQSVSYNYNYDYLLEQLNILYTKLQHPFVYIIADELMNTTLSNFINYAQFTNININKETIDTIFILLISNFMSISIPFKIQFTPIDSRVITSISHGAYIQPTTIQQLPNNIELIQFTVAEKILSYTDVIVIDKLLQQYSIDNISEYTTYYVINKQSGQLYQRTLYKQITYPSQKYVDLMLEYSEPVLDVPLGFYYGDKSPFISFYGIIPLSILISMLSDNINQYYPNETVKLIQLSCKYGTLNIQQDNNTTYIETMINELTTKVAGISIESNDYQLELDISTSVLLYLNEHPNEDPKYVERYLFDRDYVLFFNKQEADEYLRDRMDID